jgi:hypothetical protein
MKDSKQIFNIKVIPRARVNSVTRDENGNFKVHTTTAPSGGKANDAVIRALADFLDVPRSKIRIVRGQTSHNKVIEVE